MNKNNQDAKELTIEELDNIIKKLCTFETIGPHMKNAMELINYNNINNSRKTIDIPNIKDKAITVIKKVTNYFVY